MNPFLIWAPHEENSFTSSVYDSLKEKNIICELILGNQAKSKTFGQKKQNIGIRKN
jgi:hypothetical protein